MQIIYFSLHVLQPVHSSVCPSHFILCIFSSHPFSCVSSFPFHCSSIPYTSPLLCVLSVSLVCEFLLFPPPGFVFCLSPLLMCSVYPCMFLFSILEGLFIIKQIPLSLPHAHSVHGGVRMCWVSYSHYRIVIFPCLYVLGMLSQMATLKVELFVRCIGLGGIAFVATLQEVSEYPTNLQGCYFLQKYTSFDLLIFITQFWMTYSESFHVLHLY